VRQSLRGVERGEVAAVERETVQVGEGGARRA